MPRDFESQVAIDAYLTILDELLQERRLLYDNLAASQERGKDLLMGNRRLSKVAQLFDIYLRFTRYLHDIEESVRPPSLIEDEQGTRFAWVGLHGTIYLWSRQMPLLVQMNCTGELIAQVNDPDVTVLTKFVLWAFRGE